MSAISGINFTNSLVSSSAITPIYTTPVPPVSRIQPISRDTVTTQVDTKNTSKPFEETLNKYLAKYEQQQQLSYNTNTPYDKATKDLEESIVIGMNIDIQA